MSFKQVLKLDRVGLAELWLVLRVAETICETSFLNNFEGFFFTVDVVSSTLEKGKLASLKFLLIRAGVSFKDFIQTEGRRRCFLTALCEWV